MSISTTRQVRRRRIVDVDEAEEDEGDEDEIIESGEVPNGTDGEAEYDGGEAEYDGI